jgi:hypothetical protein
MAPKGRKRAFDEPIALPGSGELVTLEDAGAYITKHPAAARRRIDRPVESAYPYCPISPLVTGLDAAQRD